MQLYVRAVAQVVVVRVVGAVVGERLVAFLRLLPCLLGHVLRQAGVVGRAEDSGQDASVRDGRGGADRRLRFSHLHSLVTFSQ